MALKPLSRKMLKALDATAVAAGFSSVQLMERAGLELALILEAHLDKSKTILFLCGPGNNGGDGFVAARHLINKGFSVSVLLCSDKYSEAASANLKILKSMDVQLHSWDGSFSFSPYDVLIDCLLGYSQRGELKEPVASIVKRAKDASKEVIACDIPTGLNATTGEIAQVSLPAMLTVSFAAPKKGFAKARALCGEILIVGIGIPAAVYGHFGFKHGEYLVEGLSEF